jgi:hypothetical protein
VKEEPIMLQKYLLAFALGGLVVGGVVYFTHRPAATPVPPPAPVAVVQPQATTPQQPPQPEPQAASQPPEPVAPQRLARRQATPAQPAPAAQQAATAQPVHQPQQEQQAQAPPPPVVVKHEAQPAPILRPDPAVEAKSRTPQTVTIPAGTLLTVRLRQLISTDRQAAGDPFAATLDQPIVIDGFVIADKGSNVRGKITALDAPGRVKGRAAISLELTEINTTDGQRVDIRTDTYRNEAASGKKGDVAKLGAGAALGAIIGAIAGGGKGAAIGAGVGGAAGGGAVLATKGEDVRLTSETKLSFRLAENVTLTEKLN